MIGLSFGSKKKTESGTKTGTTNESMTGTSTNQQTQSGQTSTTSSGTQTGTTTKAGTTTTDQSQSQLGTQKTTGTQTTLDSGIVAGVGNKVNDLLGALDRDVVDTLIGDSVRDFNVDSFVADTLAAARNRGEQQLQEGMSAFGSQVGGTAGTNSMAALLQMRGRNDLEANLAGIGADARVKGEGIANQNLATRTGVLDFLGGLTSSLTGAVKGGTTTTDMTSLTDEISKLVGRGTAGETGTSSVNTQEQSNVTQLIDTISKLIENKTASSDSNEQFNTKVKSGGGFSFST